jgi:cAMP phosphodiesterase
MKVVILGSSDRSPHSLQYVSSYLINGTVAIDAGCLGFYRTPREQRAVRNVFLTHCHADHIASLPFFIENVWDPSPDCPAIYGSRETLDALRRFVFNDVVWPNLELLSERLPPFLKMHVLEPEVAVRVDDLTITPVCVDHTVPTFGYIVEDGSGAVIFAADSGPTERLWGVARTLPRLHAIFMEASFPNRMRRVADSSRHLTPSMFGFEVAKSPEGVRFIAVHMKAPYSEEIRRELAELELTGLEMGECECEYVF